MDDSTVKIWLYASNATFTYYVNVLSVTLGTFSGLTIGSVSVNQFSSFKYRRRLFVCFEERKERKTSSIQVGSLITNITFLNPKLVLWIKTRKQ